MTSQTHDDVHKAMKYGVWTSIYNEAMNKVYEGVSNNDPPSKVFLFFKTVITK